MIYPKYYKNRSLFLDDILGCAKKINKGDNASSKVAGLLEYAVETLKTQGQDILGVKTVIKSGLIIAGWKKEDLHQLKSTDIFKRSVENIDKKLKEELKLLVSKFEGLDSKVSKAINAFIENFCKDFGREFIKIKDFLESRSHLFKFIDRDCENLKGIVDCLYNEHRLERLKSILEINVKGKSFGIIDGKILLNIEEISEGEDVDLTDFRGGCWVGHVAGELKLGGGVTQFKANRIDRGGKVDASLVKGQVTIVWGLKGRINLGRGVTGLRVPTISKGVEVDASLINGPVKIFGMIEGTIELGRGVTGFEVGTISEGVEVYASLVKGPVVIEWSLKGGIKLGKDVTRFEVGKIEGKGAVEKNGYTGAICINKN